jgi:predicted dehydrogenase
MHPPVTLAIIGAGKRGEAYAAYAKLHPDQLQVVAVAEPRALLRERLAAEYQLPPERCYDGYEAFAREPKLCDAVAICTQDRMHLGPVEELAPKGYAILLEKPMSPDLPECERIIECVNTHGNLFACCHVLLYTELTPALAAMAAASARVSTVLCRAQISSSAQQSETMCPLNLHSFLRMSLSR